MTPTWTSTPPTKPGWYWVKSYFGFPCADGKRNYLLNMALVFERAGEWCIAGADERDGTPFRNNTSGLRGDFDWYGPLQPPESP